VIGWRDRYERGGIRALEDEPRSGRPPEIDEIAVVVALDRTPSAPSRT
jgi:transposase